MTLPDPKPSLSKIIFGKYKNFLHFIRAIWAILKYKYPARNLVIIGVTGTNGKTTTSHLIRHILTVSGKKTVLMSSIGIFYPGKPEKVPTKFSTTTPLAIEIQEILNQMKKDHVQFAVIECSSLGLDQHRLLGCNLHIGVVTNITYDHLDYHRTIERYIAAKTKLVRVSKYSVLNSDDKYFSTLKSKAKGKILTYGMSNQSDITLTSTKLNIPKTSIYNTYNILAAISAASLLNIPTSSIQKAINTFKYPPGHLQEVENNRCIKIFIDFAHTPNGLSHVVQFLKESYPNSAIHLVFGCEGERDSSKRPMMGEIADQLTNNIFITTCDPRSEKLDVINTHILMGITKHKEGRDLFLVPDREMAITQAIKLASPRDIVLIAGKGPEQYLQIEGKKIPWSEEKVIKGVLKHIS